MKSKVVWSASVRIITCSVVVLLAIMCVFVISMGVEVMSVVFLSMVGLAVGYCSYMSPRSIEVTDSEIILLKWMGKKRFCLDQVVAVECFMPNGSDLRLFGSGGVGGFLGRFTNDTIGIYTSYVGSYRNAFVLKMSDGKAYMLSCNDRDEVVKYINELITKKEAV